MAKIDRTIAKGPFAALARKVRAKREGTRCTDTDNPMMCCYCHHPIEPEQDGQRIARQQYAHTACAWEVEDTAG